MITRTSLARQRDRLATGLADQAAAMVRDDRGAIMVISVVASAFLVGALWYVIGVGDAILYREHMQDGGDAAAYAAAVYQARGMNLIAMINIILAGVLAVLVALKLLQLLDVIAFAVSTAICAASLGTSTYFCHAAAYTGNLKRPIDPTIKSYQRVLNVMGPALTKTEEGLAIAMPWVAEAKVTDKVIKSYKKPIDSGLMMSSSLLPFVPLRRLGLPLQKDTPSDLCKKAGDIVGHVVFKPFGEFSGWVSGILGAVVGSFPQHFCGLSGSLNLNLSDMAVNELCKQKKNLPANIGQKFDMNQCKQAGSKLLGQKVHTQLGNLPSLPGLNATGSTSFTSVRVFDEAENGNGFFQSWSIVVGDKEWPKGDDKGVEIAAWGKRLTVPTVPWGNVDFAEAEYYYDHRGEWQNYVEDAMWHMQWRARLRTVRPEGPELGGLLGGVVGQKLMSKFSGVLGNLLQKDDFIGFILGNVSGQALSGQFGQLLKGTPGLFENQAKDAALKQYDKIGVLH